MTPKEQFEDLRPEIDVLAQRIRSAPLSEPHKAGLGLLVASYFFGVECSLLGKDPYHNAREVADLIVSTMREKRPRLQVVSGDEARSDEPPAP